MALSATELYVESSYIEDGYVGGVAEAVIGISPYVEEGYIQAGYVENKGSVFTLICNTDAEILEATATLNSEFGFNTSVGRYRVSDALLEFQADLLAAGDRYRGINSTVTGVFAMGNGTGGDFSSGILPAVSYEGTADLASTASLSAEGLNVQFGDADLNSEFGCVADAIEYRSRFFDSDRPIGWSVRGYNPSNESYFDSNDYAFNSSVKKYGTASLELTNTNRFARSDPMDFTGFSSTTGSYVLEFWSRHEGIFNGDVMIAEVSDDDNALFDNIDRFAIPVFRNRIRLYRESDTSRIYLRIADLLLSTNSTYDSGIWYHFAITVNSGTVTLYINGSSVASSSGAVIGLSNPRAMLINDSNGNVSAYFDNARFAINTTDFHHNTDADNDTNTKFLARFDGNFNDDTSITFSETKTLNSTTTLNSTLNGTFGTSAALNGFASTLTVAAKSGDFVSSMDVNTTLTATSNIILEGVADLHSAFSSSVDSTVTRNTDVDINSVAELTASPTSITSGVANFNSVAGVDASVTGITGILATINSVATVSCEPVRIKQLNSDIAAEANVASTSNRVRSTDATLEVIAQLDASAVRIKSLEAQLDGFAAVLTSAAMTGQFVATLSTASSLSVEPTVLGAGSVSMEVISTVQATVGRIQQADSVLNSISTATIDATIAVASSATLQSNSSQTATPIKITDIVSNQNIVASVGVDAENFRPFGADLISATNMVVSAEKTVDANANFNSVANTNVITGKIVDASASLTAFNSIVIRARTIEVEIAVYRVPREYRTHSITSENRSHVVTNENRTYRIKEGA